MRKLLKKQGFMPKLLITDKLCSNASAFRRPGNSRNQPVAPRRNSMPQCGRTTQWYYPEKSGFGRPIEREWGSSAAMLPHERLALDANADVGKLRCGEQRGQRMR
jgi:hypothetical protein